MEIAQKRTGRPKKAIRGDTEIHRTEYTPKMLRCIRSAAAMLDKTPSEMIEGFVKKGIQLSIADGSYGPTVTRILSDAIVEDENTGGNGDG